MAEVAAPGQFHTIVSAATLGAALAAFRAAMVAADLGGPADVADKNNKRDILISLLRQLAGHVQALHDNDLAKLLDSGFEAVSTNTASTPLETPTIRSVVNGGTGRLIIRAPAIKNAKMMEARYAVVGENGAPGPWLPPRLFTNSRGMVLDGLEPGELYIIQLRAHGGSTGMTDWSDPVQHRSL
jgi:hypothetical protein